MSKSNWTLEEGFFLPVESLLRFKISIFEEVLRYLISIAMFLRFPFLVLSQFYCVELINFVSGL